MVGMPNIHIALGTTHRPWRAFAQSTYNWKLATGSWKSEPSIGHSPPGM